MDEPVRLGIPDEAWTAAGIAFLAALDKTTTSGDPRKAYLDDLVTPTVRAAAPLIVAAELRRLAAQCEPQTESRQRSTSMKRLHTRARPGRTAASMVYAKCLDGQDGIARRRVQEALGHNSPEP